MNSLLFVLLSTHAQTSSDSSDSSTKTKVTAKTAAAETHPWMLICRAVARATRTPRAEHQPLTEELCPRSRSANAGVTRRERRQHPRPRGGDLIEHHHAHCGLRGGDGCF